MRAAALLLAVAAGVANAAGIEVDAGWSRYQTQHDGTWYQDRYPHAIDAESRYWSAGVWVNRGDWRLSAGATRLGVVKSWAVADTDDNCYARYSMSPNVCAGSPILAEWRGNGDVRGLYLRAATARPSGLVTEAGLLAYWPRWTQHVDGWRSRDAPEARDLHLVHRSGWRLTPSVGIGWRLHDRAELLARWYWRIETTQRAGPSANIPEREVTNVPAMY